MIEAAEVGALSLAKLEAMTAVCSVGLDMVAIPGDTPVDVICGILADELAIGVVNQKTTAVRLMPIPGAAPGDKIEMGGLLGTAIVMDPGKFGSPVFYNRGGRIPAPVQSFRG